jgi:hypothetical protein
MALVRLRAARITTAVKIKSSQRISRACISFWAAKLAYGQRALSAGGQCWCWRRSQAGSPASGAIRLNIGMLAVSHRLGHVVALHFAGLFNPASNAISAAAGVVAILSCLAGTLPRRITYRVLSCTPVVRSAVPGLRVSYEGAELGDPHVLGVELRYRGRGDLRGSSFEGKRPFRIDVGARVIGVIGADFRLESELTVEASGSELRFGPGMVRRKELLRLLVLLDGPCGRLSHKGRPADVRVRQRRAADNPREFGMLQKVITWTLILFIIYYLASDPAGAAGVVHQAFDGLRSAGDALSSLVSSL